MAEQKTEKKNEIEREYIIPIRNKLHFVPKYKRANKAIKIVKDFLVQHMKVYDKDRDKIKLDRYLNEFIWRRGIKKPPVKVKVKVVKIGEIVKVELSEMPEFLKFKKAREEKIESKSKEKKTKEVKEESKESKESEEKKEEEKEKKSSVVEAGQKIEKEAAKHSKHQSKEKQHPTRHQVMKSLQR